MLPQVSYFTFPGCGKARRAKGKGYWDVDLTCSFRWLLQTQPDFLISLDFQLLISEGSWSSDFLVWLQLKRSVAKWQHVPSELL